MNEEQFGRGALPHKIDRRDYKFLAMATTPYDWSKEYNIEDKVGKIKVKDQNGSFSCGGQAWAYYMGVLDAVNDNKPYEEKSARFIYAQTAEIGGGSDGRKNSDLCKKQGVSTEYVCRSYENGRPPSEAWITKKELPLEAIYEARNALTEVYAQISTYNIESVAQAISANLGCVLMVNGQNNGTWLTNNPKHPTGGGEVWRHWIYACKIRIFNGRKQIGFLNSWSDMVGDSGTQWLDEDYFSSGHVPVGWVMTAKENVVLPAPQPWYIKFLALLKASNVYWDGQKWAFIK